MNTDAFPDNYSLTKLYLRSFQNGLKKIWVTRKFYNNIIKVNLNEEIEPINPFKMRGSNPLSLPISPL